MHKLSKSEIENEVTRARALMACLQGMLRATQDCEDKHITLGNCIFIAGELDVQLELVDAIAMRASGEPVKIAAE